MLDEQLTLDVPFAESRGALLSADGTYRYNLWRRWGPGLFLGYVMLNPSTADAEVDDQTIRRCCFFAKREGYDGIYVVNLYAYRATDQDDLWRLGGGGVGPDNDQHITAAILNDRIGGFVAAWGALPDLGRARQWRIREMFEDGGRDLTCLGRTKKGWPRHPSRLGNAVGLEPFPLDPWRVAPARPIQSV